MSAVAHTQVNNINNVSVPFDIEPAVTTISVTARIDYIQRFSKQAVLVVENNVDVYSHTARQFLSSLSKSHSKEHNSQETNVAFVAASSKLNDIQMRCRLIEQLFANTLFDPEQSLAVSILRLGKQDSDVITIVVEHAHALSLQVKYELCQLVDVANKTHKKINVVLFGYEQAAQEIANNKSIFKNKLSIIDAGTGQLFALDHAKFKQTNGIFSTKFLQKLTLIITVSMMILGLSWFALIEFDNFSLSKLPMATTLEADKTLVSLEKNKAVINNTLSLTEKTSEMASINEINLALLAANSSKPFIKQQTAQSADILQALDFTDKKEVDKLIVDSKLSATKLLANEPIKVEQASSFVKPAVPFMLTPQYYLNADTGYVVQIAGFTDMTVLSAFIDDFQKLEYFSYERVLNDQPFIVLTSKIYPSKAQANAAIKVLPQAILQRGPWLKSLVIVKNEINSLNISEMNTVTN